MPTPAAPSIPDDGALPDINAGTLRNVRSCERRLWLSTYAKQEAAPPTESDLELRERGVEHERDVLAATPGPIGPIYVYPQPMAAAIVETARRLNAREGPLYQAALGSRDGTRKGVPDFLVWDGDTLVVREVKLATNLNRRPEIPLQLEHYASLIEELLPEVAVRLEVVNGRGERVSVARDPDAYAAELAKARAVLAEPTEPDLLKSRSTCEQCPFCTHCWTRALQERRVEVLTEVKSSDLDKLTLLGIRTFDELAASDGDQLRAVGLRKQADRMIQAARAWSENRPVIAGPNPLPAGRPLVWFDLEATRSEDEAPIDLVYLWGLAVESETGASAYEAILAENGAGDDESTWRRFLARAGAILDRAPDACFVHYASYERDKLKRYAERFPDTTAAADRVRARLFDLCDQGVRKAVCLPLVSYSIKKVAPYVGFRWTNPATGGLWSTVQYRLAMEEPDPTRRRALFAPIVEYNHGDLLAMRAVWHWLEELYAAGGRVGKGKPGS
jgi:predicted RecB family nuclease